MSDFSVGVITCIVDSIPHLVAVNATRLVGVIVLKDSLKERERVNLMSITRVHLCRLNVSVRETCVIPTCHCLILFHRCLNSWRLSLPVPSIWTRAVKTKTVWRIHQRPLTKQQHDYSVSLKLTFRLKTSLTFPHSITWIVSPVRFSPEHQIVRREYKLCGRLSLCLQRGLGPVSAHHRPRHGSRQVVPPTDNTASPMHSIQRIRPSEQSCSCSSPGWSPLCSGPYLEGDTGDRERLRGRGWTSYTCRQNSLYDR